jgi:ketosteroid isomerase-like protein
MVVGTVIAAAVGFFGALLPITGMAAGRDTELNRTANDFMDAYVAGDWHGVAAHLTRGVLYVYGSDLAEFSTDVSGFKAMFDHDQALWHGAARFGAMSEISSRRRGDMATLFFNRVFELGTQKVVVRFSTVWQREGGGWKLVQSSNVVPTTGQSAAEILAHPKQ